MPLTPEHDYAYRAFVSREVFAEVLARWNESITRTSTASRKPIALTRTWMYGLRCRLSRRAARADTAAGKLT